jgi:hypothetical protein
VKILKADLKVMTADLKVRLYIGLQTARPPSS